MRTYEQEKLFYPPFCGQLEVQYWLDLTERLEMTYHGLSVPVGRPCFAEDTQTEIGDAVWQWWKYGAETGLGINGPIAGYFVHKEDFRDGLTLVDIGRAVALDGAGFFVEQALEHLNYLDINPKHAKRLQDQLTGQTVSYRTIIVTILEWLEYPIDRRRFLINVRNANVLGNI